MDNKLALAALLLYNEQIYVDEWVNFHLKQGFDLICMYIIYKNDKDRNDDLIAPLVEKYKNNKCVKITHCKYYHPYVHKCEFLKNEAPYHPNDWLCVLDIDEFIYSPIKDKSVKDIVREYEENNIDAVRVNWRCFGSSGLVSKPEHILQSFTKCSHLKHPINFETKSIQKINVIGNVGSSHEFILKKTTQYCTTHGVNQTNYNIMYKDIMHKTRTHAVNQGELAGSATNYIQNKFNHHVYPEDEPKLVVNHYIIRSSGEYQLKINNNPHRRDRYNMNRFNIINSICDNIDNFDIQSKM